MSLLADPRICPDCRSPLDPQRTCTGCGLPLTGQLAANLWEHILEADRLVEAIRLAAPSLASDAVPATAPSVQTAPDSLTTGLPTAPPVPARPQAARPARRTSSLSVQVVLLGIGGLCLFVAAAVFVAVSWSDLGLAGRTIVLAAITALVGSIAVVLTRRGLRGSAETLWLLTSALVSIDLVAARAAGLMGDLDVRHVAGLLGAVLLLGSLAASVWASTTRTARLHGMVGVSAGGALLLTAGEAWTAPNATLATAFAVPALIGAGLLIRRLSAGRLAPSAYAVGAIGVLDWGVLVAQGLDRADVPASDWWQHLQGWPLLVAALWAAAPTAIRRLPEPVRYLAAAASLLTMTAFVLGAQVSDDSEVLLLSGAALALALVTALAPVIWARPAGVMTLVAGFAAATATAVRPFGVIDLLPTTAPMRAANLHERLPDSTWTVAPWTAPVIAVVAVLAALSLIRHLPESRRTELLSTWKLAAPTVLGLSLVSVLLENRPDLVVAVATWAALVVLAAALAYLARSTPVALATAVALALYLTGVGLRLAVPSHLLVATFATIAALVLAAAVHRGRVERLEGLLMPVLAVPAVFLAGFAATHWPYVAHAGADTIGISLVLVMAAIGLGAGRFGRTERTRIAIEASALLGALVAVSFPYDEVVAALTLTIAGSAVALVSILRRDRDRFSWLAAALLAGATLMRLSQDAAAPEALAIPAACLLVAAGVWRLTHDDEVSSWRALGSGLSLGLVPSLLLALDEPVSLRGALIAAAGVAVLALGVVRRWSAPFWVGAAVVALLAVRHLGPVAAGLPRWISLGSVGIALLVVGITWEARRRDAAAAERYLAALR
jgi:hypothetical protein